MGGIVSALLYPAPSPPKYGPHSFPDGTLLWIPRKFGKAREATGRKEGRFNETSAATTHGAGDKILRRRRSRKMSINRHTDGIESTKFTTSNPMLNLESGKRTIRRPHINIELQNLDQKNRGRVTLPRIRGDPSENPIPCLLAAPRYKDLKKAKFLVIYAHANGCDLGNISQEMFYLAGQLGVYFLAVEYRGYGLSPGKPCEGSLNDDLAVVYEYATEVLSVPSDRIILWGCSLGTGLCTNLAANLCDLQRSPAALILQAPYKSILAAAKDMSSIIPDVGSWPSWRNEERIKRVTSHLLLLHGEQDKMIKISHSQWIYANATKSRGATLATCKTSNHNVWNYHDEVIPAVRSFLRRLEAKKACRNNIPVGNHSKIQLDRRALNPGKNSNHSRNNIPIGNHSKYQLGRPAFNSVKNLNHSRNRPVVLKSSLSYSNRHQISSDGKKKILVSVYHESEQQLLEELKKLDPYASTKGIRCERGKIVLKKLRKKLCELYVSEISRTKAENCAYSSRDVADRLKRKFFDRSVDMWNINALREIYARCTNPDASKARLFRSKMKRTTNRIALGRLPVNVNAQNHKRLSLPANLKMQQQQNHPVKQQRNHQKEERQHQQQQLQRGPKSYDGIKTANSHESSANKKGQLNQIAMNIEPSVFRAPDTAMKYAKVQLPGKESTVPDTRTPMRTATAGSGNIRRRSWFSSMSSFSSFSSSSRHVTTSSHY